MSQIRPLGRLQFNKSLAADVVAYRLYGAPVVPDAPVALNYSNMLGEFPAPDASQATVVIDLATVNGIQTADGQSYAFSVASVDSAGNVSDLSEPLVHPLDATAPDAPTGLSWLDSSDGSATSGDA